MTTDGVIKIKINRLNFREFNHVQLGKVCQMEVRLAATVGGSAKYYDWNLPYTPLSPAVQKTLQSNYK